MGRSSQGKGSIREGKDVPEGESSRRKASYYYHKRGKPSMESILFCLLVSEVEGRKSKKGDN